uniref:Uncharacterized protein n=1 Tax=Arundo donax TaxID=35708 RepID=A0A0A8YQV0_ARUDO
MFPLLNSLFRSVYMLMLICVFLVYSFCTEINTAPNDVIPLP